MSETVCFLTSYSSQTLATDIPFSSFLINSNFWFTNKFTRLPFSDALDILIQRNSRQTKYSDGFNQRQNDVKCDIKFTHCLAILNDLWHFVLMVSNSLQTINARRDKTITVFIFQFITITTYSTVLHLNFGISLQFVKLRVDCTVISVKQKCGRQNTKSRSLFFARRVR